MKKKVLLLLTCLTLMTSVSFARMVNGIVLEAATDDPVIGASVKAKGNPAIGTEIGRAHV